LPDRVRWGELATGLTVLHNGGHPQCPGKKGEVKMKIGLCCKKRENMASTKEW